MAMSGPLNAEPSLSHGLLDFNALDGWAADDHSAALSVFLKTCDLVEDPDWRATCAAASQAPDARRFFETAFRPVMISDGSPALFTGYFEPELRGALERSDRFHVPLHAMPQDARDTHPWFSRQEIETGGVMKGRGLELVWLDDPVEKFFLQVQGSGRIRFPDGRTMRVGYAGSNGHPYRSIGKELVRRGTFAAGTLTAEGIKDWLRRNRADGESLMHHNPSYVFFREITEIDAETGPIGAMDRSVTPLRSLAVDPAFVPLGAPVWIEKDGARQLRRLMIAQDTGSAIKGPQRADIFYGTGDEAGKTAGQVQDPGRMVVLLPRARAEALATGPDQ